MKRLSNKKIRSGPALQFWYKLCIHPRSYKKVMISFLCETICRGGAYHHPPLKIIFSSRWCYNRHIEIVFISRGGWWHHSPPTNAFLGGGWWCHPPPTNAFLGGRVMVPPAPNISIHRDGWWHHPFLKYAFLGVGDGFTVPKNIGYFQQQAMPSSIPKMYF